MSRLPLVAGLLAAILATAPTLSAQEDLEQGKMWTFENPPLEYLQAVYGFTPSQAWLDHTRLSSLRFGGGCSASFVSPKGLILTNHHCARDQIAEVSPKGQDWVKDGFIAGSMAEEVPVPGLTVQQLVSMTDVTDAINRGIGPDDDDATVDRKRKENEEEVLAKAKRTHPDLKPELVKLYHGGMFQLYVYRVFDDVRLVAAPHLASAHFGGDPDNFTYPRYCLDFALCRAYVDGKPADTSEHYFKWSKSGAADGELVFVTGSPGSTGRMLTYDTLEYRRDAYYPILHDYIKTRVDITKEAMKALPEGSEKRKALRTDLLSDLNSRKAFEGYWTGLKDSELMARKRKAERAFRAKVAADPALREKYGDAWDKMAKIAEERTEILPRLWYHSSRDCGTIRLAGLVLASLDPERSEEERAEARELARAEELGDAAMEQAHLTAKFKAAHHWLGMTDKFVRAAMSRGDAAETARAIVEDSMVRDPKTLEALLDGSTKPVPDDPAFAVASVIRKMRPDALKRWAALGAQENVQIARIGQALFAVYGTKVSPDATFTLRLSDGVVKGFPFNGTVAPPATSFYGLYGRVTEFGNEYPFDIPQIWLDRQERVDLAKPINFVSTNDIIGGNSGSPLINKNREIVGLAFDGNIEMLPNRYLYRDAVARTVSVHSVAIIEALSKVYDAGWLVKELTGRAPRKIVGTTPIRGNHRTGAQVQIRQLKQAVRMFQLREGRLPRESEWQAFLFEGSDKHPDPYLDKAAFAGDEVLDPWRNPYHYRKISSREFEIFSLGADGEPGGDGANADISSKRKAR